MAKKDNDTTELEFEGMPGADAKTEEDVAPFQVDMNFEEPELRRQRLKKKKQKRRLLERKQQKKLQRSKSKKLQLKNQKVKQKHQNQRQFKEMMSNLWKQWRKAQRK